MPRSPVRAGPGTHAPEGRLDETRRVRLQRAKVQMLDHQLPEASAALRELADQLEADKSADPKLRDDAREALANSQYYMTWLMRLEGLGADGMGARDRERPPDLPHACRTGRGSAAIPTREQHREDLESAIRLARLDVGDLQGLEIPKQCQGCKSGQCKKPGNGRRKSPNSQKKDARSAGAGPPPDIRARDEQ